MGQVLTVQVRVDLRVMVLKKYFIFHKTGALLSNDLESYPGNLLGESLTYLQRCSQYILPLNKRNGILEFFKSIFNLFKSIS